MRAPLAQLTRSAENLGEVLSGAIIQNSPYELNMGRSEFKIACRSELSKQQRTSLSQKVKQDYRVHMIMDNLPAATKMIAGAPVAALYARRRRRAARPGRARAPA